MRCGGIACETSFDSRPNTTTSESPVSSATADLDAYCAQVMRDAVVDEAEAEALLLWRNRMPRGAWEAVLARNGISPLRVEAMVSAPVLQYRRPRSVVRAGEVWFLHFKFSSAGRVSGFQIEASVEAAGRRVARRKVTDERQLFTTSGVPVQFPEMKPGHHVVRIEVTELRDGRQELWAGWFDIMVDAPSGGATNIFVSGDNNTVTGGDSLATGSLKYGDQQGPRAEDAGDWLACPLTPAGPRARVARSASPGSSVGLPRKVTIRRTAGASPLKRVLFGSSIVIGRSDDPHIDLRLVAPPGPGDGDLHAALRFVSNRALVLDATSLPTVLRIEVANRSGARVAGIQLDQGSSHDAKGVDASWSTSIDLGAATPVRVDIRALPRRAGLRNVDRSDIGPEGRTELLSRKSRLGGFSIAVTVDGRRCEYVWVLGSLPAEHAGFSDAGFPAVIIVTRECPWAVECPPKSGSESFNGELLAWPISPGARIDFKCGSSYRVSSGIEFH